MKRLVVDIDDTISFTINRDFENATPNVVLIKKLNELFDNGVEIYYVTARGSLSCGSREEAKEKYEKQILDYFSKHGVKYTALSFDKFLADYYIDDKSITPDEFLKLDVEILHGGLSGGHLERRGDKVYKTCKNALDITKWVNTYKNKIKTPEIHSLIGTTICMDYIKESRHVTIDDLIKIYHSFYNTRPIYNKDFKTYINRVQQHLDLYSPSYSDWLITELELESDYFNRNKTGCHGDLSIDNIICAESDVYLIDPNVPSDVYESVLLDISKTLVSLRRFDKIDTYNVLNKLYASKHIKLLEITHWIRMRKYHPDQSFVDHNINKCILEYKNA